MPKIPNNFARGMPFHLVIILDKNGMKMNVNCNGSKRINLNKGTEIVFENPHLINVGIGIAIQLSIHYFLFNFADHWRLQILEFSPHKCSIEKIVDD
jgi:hypothetical protein